MLTKFLQEIVSIVVGKQFETVVDFLNKKKYVNEFILAKKLGVTINQMRNILYKLSDYGLVSSIRKKDKKKGWYTYFWKFEVLKSLQFLENFLSKKIEQINYQIKSRETKTFYVCERCKVEFTEGNALLKNFTCDECGGVFTMKDNTKVLRELKKNLNKLEEKLFLVRDEIKKEQKKIEKAKERKNKTTKKDSLKKSVKTKKTKALPRKISTKKVSVKKTTKSKHLVVKTKKKKTVKKSTRKNKAFKSGASKSSKKK